jgi:hypothetical protein
MAPTAAIQTWSNLCAVTPQNSSFPATCIIRSTGASAAIIDSAAIRAGVVTMDSTVEFEDLDTGEVEEYTLTFPDRANVEEKIAGCR